MQSLRIRRWWLTLCALIWALWWGGLTFYASIVVPEGTRQLGSFGQGLITQKVSSYHHWISLALLACLLVESTIQKSLALGIQFVLLLAVTLGLFVVHERLTSMIDFEQPSVAEGFYSMHASYLWMTTAEWVLGIILAFQFVSRVCSRVPSSSSSDAVPPAS